MKNKKNNMVLAALLGLLAVAALGAWVMMNDGEPGSTPSAPVKPTVEVRRSEVRR